MPKDLQLKVLARGGAGRVICQLELSSLDRRFHYRAHDAIHLQVMIVEMPHVAGNRQRDLIVRPIRLVRRDVAADDPTDHRRRADRDQQHQQEDFRADPHRVYLRWRRALLRPDFREGVHRNLD